MKVFAIRDRKSDTFHAPFFQPNDEVAVRAIAAHMRSEPNSMISLYPDDYELFHIGNWDETSGLLEGKTHTFVTHLSALASAKE